jgi:hypothetical protein
MGPAAADELTWRALRLIRRYSLKAGQPTGVARLDDLTSAVEGILHDQDEKVEQANAAEQAVELEADTPAQSLACVPALCPAPPLRCCADGSWTPHAPCMHALRGTMHGRSAV